MRRFRDFAVDDFLQGVDALPFSVESVHKMHIFGSRGFTPLSNGIVVLVEGPACPGESCIRSMSTCSAEKF